MRKVKVYYGHLNQADLEDFINYIVLCLTGNANFPDLPESLADITSTKNSWVIELGKSRQGDRDATQKAAGLESNLIVKIRKNGNYINNIAAGDVGKLDSSGYALTKVPEINPQPSIQVVQGENSGSGMVVIEAFPDAICYLVDIAPDPCPSPDSKEWSRLKLSSKCKIPVSGLDPRKLYWIRFCYLTKDGEKDYSQPVSFSIK